MGFEIQLFGIPVWISVWSLLLGAFFCLHAFAYISKRTPNLSTERYVFAAASAAVAAILSIGAHEWAHAIVAKWVGVEIVGAGLTGWGAYVLPEVALSETTPWKEIVIALAGPAMNFLIGAITAVPVYLLRKSLLENTIRYVSYINISLGWLNLLPINILDGGKVLHGFLWAALGNAKLASILMIPISTAVFIFWFLRKRGKHLED